jgi:hypothetical protein
MHTEKRRELGFERQLGDACLEVLNDGCQILISTLAGRQITFLA